jgi:hypothetical protein
LFLPEISFFGGVSLDWNTAVSGCKHLHEGGGLLHGREVDNVRRRSGLKEALNHIEEIVCATDGVRLYGSGFHSEQTQEDDDERGPSGKPARRRGLAVGAIRSCLGGRIIP